MRVLLSLQHQLDENLGAPGITLSIAAALREKGCSVSTFGFREAWPGMKEPSVKHSVAFHSRLRDPKVSVWRCSKGWRSVWPPRDPRRRSHIPQR